MQSLKIQNWDESYDRKENYIFFPKEEVVKFLNRFVRRKIGPTKFENRIQLEEDSKALDLGCGIGRQTILLKEFGFDAYGVDISEKAILQAKDLSKNLGHDLESNFLVLKELQLPFPNDYFDIAISDSVLDSMEFSFAKKYIKELERTVKSYVYLSLISSESNKGNIAIDTRVEGDYEHGTIQSYYNLDRIKELIQSTSFEILQLNKNSTQDHLKNSINGRYHIVLKKKHLVA